MKTIIAIAVAALVVFGGWWWMQHPPAAPAPSNKEQSGTTTQDTSAQNPYAYAPGNLLLGTDATSTIGTYLIASNGMTLYTYAKDIAGTSNCTGLCTKAWPPYTVDSRDVLRNVQAGIRGNVDTTVRADGSMQVTYDGDPLYFFSQDKVSGDMLGQGIASVWYAAKP
jgi:predicted lipoprotein with Yx(FWY)xxD motif